MEQAVQGPMNIIYYLKDFWIYVKYNLFEIKNNIVKFFSKNTMITFGNEFNKIINIKTLWIILILLIIIRLMQKMSQEAVIVFFVLIPLIGYYTYKDWKLGKHRFWERERKGYKMNKDDFKN